MSWELYSWTFRLCSPLHVGFHRIIHLSRTRPYVPGRLIWGVLTAKSAVLLGLSDYHLTGRGLEEAFRFGYLYLCLAEGTPYLPRYTMEEGLRFGLGAQRFTQREFEKQFLGAVAAAAIEPESFTAEEGMLRHVEFINPYLAVRTKAEGFTPVYLKGLFWARETETKAFRVVKKGQGIAFMANEETKEVDLAHELVDCFQIGGERRCGFGLLALEDGPEPVRGGGKGAAANLPGFPGRWYADQRAVYLTIGKDEPVWGHVLDPEKVPARGLIEPLVGRSWDQAKGAGQMITSDGLAWAPGSVPQEERTFVVGPHGLWAPE